MKFLSFLFFCFMITSCSKEENTSYLERHSTIDVSIYPNPARDNITLTSNRFNPAMTLDIFNAQGVIVYSTFLPETDAFKEYVDLRSLDVGLYFLSFNAEGYQSLQLKLIIER